IVVLRRGRETAVGVGGDVRGRGGDLRPIRGAVERALDDETSFVVRIVGPREVDLRRRRRGGDEVARRDRRGEEHGGGRGGDVGVVRRERAVHGARAIGIRRAGGEAGVAVCGDVGGGRGDLREGHAVDRA